MQLSKEELDMLEILYTNSKELQEQYSTLKDFLLSYIYNERGLIK